MKLPALPIGMVVLGILLPLWLLCALAVIWAALSGRWLLSLLLGLFLDVLWGVPPSGAVHMLWAPMVLLSAASIFAWAWGRKSLFSHSLPERV